MTFTVSLAELSIFIIAISFLILVVSLIPAITQLRQTAKAVQEFSEQGKRVLEDVKEITHRVNGQVGDMEETVKKFKDVTLKATGVAEVVIDAIKGPVLKMAGVMAGITFGLKHFRKGEKKMCGNNHSGGTNTVLGFLLGGAIGAGIALLYAPASGEETRRRIREGAEKARVRTKKDMTPLWKRSRSVSKPSKTLCRKRRTR